MNFRSSNDTSNITGSPAEYSCLKKCLAITTVLLTGFVFLLIFVILKSDGIQQPKAVKAFIEGAFCMDNSKQIIYTDIQSPGQILIYFEDQELCLGGNSEEIINNCKLKQAFLSSNNAPDSITFAGILSNSKDIIGGLSVYTKVVIKGCDGSGYLGNKALVSSTGQTINLNGQNNVIMILEYIKKIISPQFASIVLAGSGQGGIACLFWEFYVKQQFPNADVKLLIENGYYSYNFDNNLLQQSNQLKIYSDSVSFQQKIPNNPCFLQNSDQQWKCLLPSVLVTTVQSPVFWIISTFNSRWLKFLFGIQCNYAQCDSSSKIKMDQYANNLISDVQNSQRNRDIFWLPNCDQFSYLLDNRIISYQFQKQIIINNQISLFAQNIQIGYGTRKLIASSFYSSQCD